MTRYILIAVVATAVASPFAIYYAHRNGLCLSEFRFVSESELIDAAIADEIEPNRLLATLDAAAGSGAIPVAYDNPMQFRELNPGCCRVLTGTEESGSLHIYGLIDRLFGYHSASVLLKYQLRYRDSEGKNGVQPVESIVPVSSCGRVHLEALRGG